MTIVVRGRWTVYLRDASVHERIDVVEVVLGVLQVARVHAPFVFTRHGPLSAGRSQLLLVDRRGQVGIERRFDYLMK